MQKYLNRHVQRQRSCDVQGDSEKNEVRKQKYDIKFRQEWKTRFSWLQQENSPQGKKCTLCNTSITGGLAHIIRHASCETHKRYYSIAKGTPKMQEFVKNKQQRDTVSDAAQKLAIRFAAFVAEHNLPFSSLDHLNILLKETIIDSEIVKKLTINRIKAQRIIKSVTAPENVSNITQFCQNHYYSVIVDESTDTTCSKNLAIIIRIYDTNCRDRFLDLVPITDSSAKGIFEAIKNVLYQNYIPLENMIAFTADNCSVMMGVSNGVQAKLKELIPNLYVNGCICHKLNLISCAASQSMPKEIDKFIKSINQHFCHSPNRKADFTEFQEYFGSELHPILKYTATRWLSRQAVIERIIEQWDALKYYFTLNDFEKKDKDENVSFITSILLSPIYKLYCLFLAYILKIINMVNLEMQSENARIHILLPRLTFLFNQIAPHFIKKEYLDSVSISEIDLETHKIDIRDVYCGAEAELFICQNKEKIKEEDVVYLKKNVEQFCVNFCRALKKKINFNDNVLILASKLSPSSVLSGNIQSIVPLIYLLFPKCEITKIEDINTEYRALAEHPDLKNLANLNICEFWEKVRTTENILDEPLFSNIYRTS